MDGYGRMQKIPMRGRRCVCAAGLVAILVTPATALAQVAAPPAALQQEIDQLRRDIETLRQQYEQRVADLEARVAALQARQPGQVPSVPAGADAAGGQPGSLPVYGAASGSKVFNPDIAVVGDVLGTTGRNAVTPSPALELHEVEAAVQATVDPYARADFFFAFSPEGVEIEEAYATLPSLPAGLLVRAGKMRAAFGKMNGLHTHAVPWADRPLVTGNLLGGEEGISDVGVSVARLVPNPWLFLEVTGQLFAGNAEDVFTSTSPGEVAYLGHLRAYEDLSESTNLDFGASYARGHNGAGIVGDTDVGQFTTSLYGVDATLRWKPLRRSIYRSFAGRAEVVWSRREQFDAPQDAMGFYASGDYQFARRWFAGFRYDRSGRADAAELVDSGQSATLTFWPSEFSQIRGQYRRVRFAEGPIANEFLLQMQFSIGVHGAHPF
jgi:hypothetical protein